MLSYTQRVHIKISCTRSAITSASQSRHLNSGTQRKQKCKVKNRPHFHHVKCLADSSRKHCDNSLPLLGLLYFLFEVLPSKLPPPVFLLSVSSLSVHLHPTGTQSLPSSQTNFHILENLNHFRGHLLCSFVFSPRDLNPSFCLSSASDLILPTLLGPMHSYQTPCYSGPSSRISERTAAAESLQSPVN